MEGEAQKKKRRYRKVLTAEQRYEIIKAFENEGRMMEMVQDVAKRFDISSSHVYHIFQHREAINNCYFLTRAGCSDEGEPSQPSETEVEKREEGPKPNLDAEKPRQRSPRPMSLLTQIKIIEHVERQRGDPRRRSLTEIRHRFHVSAAEINRLYDARAAIRKEFAQLAVNIGELCAAEGKMSLESPPGSSQNPALPTGISIYSAVHATTSDMADALTELELQNEKLANPIPIADFDLSPIFIMGPDGNYYQVVNSGRAASA